MILKRNTKNTQFGKKLLKSQYILKITYIVRVHTFWMNVNYIFDIHGEFNIIHVVHTFIVIFLIAIEYCIPNKKIYNLNNKISGRIHLCCSSKVGSNNYSETCLNRTLSKTNFR